MGDSAFNEEYIGKLPELVEVSNLFDSMIKQVARKHPAVNPNKLSETQKIEGIIKNLFGFKAVYIYWQPNFGIDASTLAVDIFVASSEASTKLLSRSKGHGFYDTTNSCKAYIFMGFGLLSGLYNITGSEITAFLLHEVGHSTDDYPFFHMGLLQKIYLKSLKESGVIVNPRLHNKYKKEAFDTEKKEENKNYRSMKSFDNRFSNVEELHNNGYPERGVLETVAAILRKVPKTIFAAATFNFKSRKMISDRKAEQWADSFATAYGYGPELITAFNKYDLKDHELDKANHDNLLADLYYTELDLYNTLTDEHPNVQSRCKDCIIKLKNDLESGHYPSEMKKSISNDIKLLEEQYDMIVNCYPDQRVSIIRGFRKICDHVYGGRLDYSKKYGQHQM